jgi:hypothetical protein
MSAICAYLSHAAPLTSQRIDTLWDELDARHMQLFLRWLASVLAPHTYLSTEGPYFVQGDDERARVLVLNRLCALVTQGRVDLSKYEDDGIECLVSLFLWVNKDKRVFKDAAPAPMASIDSDDDSVRSPCNTIFIFLVPHT